MVVSPTIAAPFSVRTSDHQGRGTIAALMIGNDIGSSHAFRRRVGESTADEIDTVGAAGGIPTQTNALPTHADTAVS